MKKDAILNRYAGRDQLVKVGANSDVVETVVSFYQQYREQPQELVDEIQQLSAEEKVEAIFSYLVQNVVYKLDPAGKQFVKSPARLIYDGAGDCKSFTIFVASCLHCVGIKHIIRFVDFDGDGQYTHVYPVAIVGGLEVPMDACEKDSDGYILLDYAREYVQKRDFIFS